jgi:hypothetical protein
MSDFFTNFPATENPISQGGIWIQQDPDQTKLQTVTGACYGTQAGTGAFDDSQGYLLGFGDSYTMEVTVAVKGGLGSAPPSREVAFLLRASDTTLSTSMVNHGYECGLSFDGAYANIGRFKGANLIGLGGGFGFPGSIGFTPVTGDKFTGRVFTSGGTVVINTWWNGTDFGLNTVDTDASLKILNGNPGMDMFIGTGGPGTQDDFKITDLTINILLGGAGIDPFTRSDGALGTNWHQTGQTKSLAIVSNQVRENHGSVDGIDGTAVYTGILWSNDQYAQIRLVAASANRAPYVLVRSDNVELTNTAGKQYFVYVIGPFGATATIVLAKMNAGFNSYAELYNSGATQTVAANDILQIRAVGSIISVRLNGTLVTSQTDTDITYGCGGIGIADFNAGSETEAILDDFQGGSISAGGLMVLGVA